jgi:pilus assembly protein CpaE
MSLAEMDNIKQKVKIIVNRVGLDGGQISLKKAQDTMGREIFWQLPNDYRTMSEVRNNGVPLIEQAPKASITQSIVQLAATMSGVDNDGEVADSKSTGKGRWFGLWPTKAKS